MIKRNLSSADMVAVADTTVKRLRILVEEGILEPIEGGNGRGSHRRYSAAQALSLTMLCRLVDAGMNGPAMLQVPEYLAEFSEKQLLAKFRAGHTHLLIAPDAVRLIRPPCRGLDSLNVEAVYREVVTAIETIQTELAPEGRGRRRGLAMEATKR